MTLEEWTLEDKKLVESDIGRYVDAIYIAKFIGALLEVMEDGFGDINMKITVKGGKIKMVSVAKSHNYDLEHLSRKD